VDMISWLNTLPGTTIDIDDVPEGVVDYVRGVSYNQHISPSGEPRFACLVVVNINEVVRT
jgi:hypothetical protein